MNCANRQPNGEPCGHSEMQHELDPASGRRGKCTACDCQRCDFTFRADDDGNVRPPSVEIQIERNDERGDEPTKDFDTSDVDTDPERTKP